MLTKNPLQNIPQNYSATLQAMQQQWLFCPESDIANLFYFKSGGVDQRVSCYIVDQIVLRDLFSQVDENKPINLRLYMASVSDIPYGAIENDIPAFRPIIQVFNTDNNPKDIFTNAIIVDRMYDPSDTGETPITATEANQMNTDWNNYLKADLPQLFETQDVRINFTTFDDSDSETIRNVFINNPGAERLLYVYMGYEMPTEAAKPFGFRFVLNMVADIPSVGITENYFEFSNPCPPACDI